MTEIAPDVIAAAQAAEAKWHIPASVSLAQYGDESAWGKDEPPGSLNGFGIKALPGQPFVNANTHEVIHGETVEVVATFRKFDSLADAFDAHAELLATKPIYKPAMAALPNVGEFCSRLTGTYATDPQYGSKLVELINEDGLEQYDARAQPLPSPDPIPQPAPPAIALTPAPAAQEPTPVTMLPPPPAVALPPSPPVTQAVAQQAPTIAAGIGLAPLASLLTVNAHAYVSFAAFLNAEWPLLTVGVLIPVALYLVGRLLQALHISQQSAAGQAVVAAVQNGVKALAAQGLSYADAHATVDVRNQAVANIISYVAATVPTKLAASGITPTALAALTANRLALISPAKATS